MEASQFSVFLLSFLAANIMTIFCGTFDNNFPLTPKWHLYKRFSNAIVTVILLVLNNGGLDIKGHHAEYVGKHVMRFFFFSCANIYSRPAQRVLMATTICRWDGPNIIK